MSLQERDAAELERLLKHALGAAPHDIDRQDTWLFVYGSMLEDPPFEAAERRIAVLRGYHRSFCLADPYLRGTPDKPGLTLGLDVGGECRGLAWRLPQRTGREGLEAFWSAEMRWPFYQAAWRGITLQDGRDVPALALLADPASPHFEPNLTRETIARRIAASRGPKGPNAGYLDLAAGGLERAGAPDADLEALAARVRAVADGR